MSRPYRPTKQIDGVLWWWCNQGKHFVAPDGFNKNGTQKCGLDGRCRECKRFYYEQNKEQVCARIKAYREANPEAVRVRKKIYYEANKERLNQQTREWHHANRPQLLIQKKERYEKNKDRYLQSQRRYKAENPEKVKLAQRRCYEAKPDYYKKKSANWYSANSEYVHQREKRKRINNREELAHKRKERRKTHPELFQQWGRNRYARRKGAKGKYTREQWIQKCEFWGWRCYLCRAVLTDDAIHADHRIPLMKGGSNWISNIAPACVSCNAAKGAKTEAEYRARLAA